VSFSATQWDYNSQNQMGLQPAEPGMATSTSVVSRRLRRGLRLPFLGVHAEGEQPQGQPSFAQEDRE